MAGGPGRWRGQTSDPTLTILFIAFRALRFVLEARVISDLVRNV